LHPTFVATNIKTKKLTYQTVTGGAGTLALAAARALLEHGLSNLTLFDLRTTFTTSDPAIQSLITDFPSAKIVCTPVDVTDAPAVTTAFAAAASTHSIDILLCFAGVVGCTHAIEMTPDQWRRTLDINTTGSFLCAQAAAIHMRNQNTGGSIVFTASISAHRVNFPQPQVAYNVSKAAVLAMKDSLAAEWARWGIRVNSISPGYMDTVLNEGAGLEEARGIWAKRNPMGRMGQVGELDGVVVLLCSGAGSYVTGADFVIDGGATVF
jgi:sorbose reductase